MCSVLFSVHIHYCLKNFGDGCNCFTDKSIFSRSKSGAFCTCRFDGQSKYQETRKYCEICENEDDGNNNGDNVDTYIQLHVPNVCKFWQYTQLTSWFYFYLTNFFFFSVFLSTCPFFLPFHLKIQSNTVPFCSTNVCIRFQFA